MSGPEHRLQIAFLGFGEAAHAIVDGWRKAGLCFDVSAFDIKSDDQKTALEVATKCSRVDVVNAAGPESAVERSTAIFSLVTADQALAAAQSAAPCLTKGALYIDCNSCSPQTKRQASMIIEDAGGAYVDAAIMSPIYPQQHRTPFLISGEHVETAVKLLGELNMDVTVMEGEIGDASSVKMIRSIVVKGLEALTAECMLAGQKAGVGDRVIRSLEKSYPGFGWVQRSTYSLERMMVHGTRRAAEMREVAKTVEQLGLDNSMSKSIANWQQAIGDLNLDPGPEDFCHRAGVILEKLEGNKHGFK